MKHQALRDAIRNLMKENDETIAHIDHTEWNQDALMTGIQTLAAQNIALQAILDAHKQPLSDERKNNHSIDAYR